MERVSAPERPAVTGIFWIILDYFDLFKISRRPWLDSDSLKAVFLRLAARYHPDKVRAAGPAEQAAANERYAELNAAYHCLFQPKERLRHLLELESGAKPEDVQSLPPGTMDLLVEIGRVCRETDLFLAARSKTESPLLKVRMFETGMAWTGKLNQLRQRIDLRREELLAELKGMNTAWNAAPPPGSAGRAAALPLERLEQIYRVFGYAARWMEQIQERLVQLSF
ncbi:MAG: J domain-containing protein [Limisphaerales bacterium]